MLDLKMILPMLPMGKIGKMIAENSDKIIEMLEEKAIKDIELLKGESKACMFLFTHKVNQEKTLLAMTVTVDKDMNILRKIKYIDLKELVKNLDLQKLINSLSENGGFDEEE